MFQATVNLESAFRHLRFAHIARVLRIDAICLNQQDDEEKASQIPLMHLIYQRATSVVVWLVPTSQDSTLADGHVCTVNEWIEPGREAEIHYAVHYDNWPISRSASPADAARRESGACVLQTSYRPWWRRAWIQQAVSMSEDIVFQ